MPGKMVEEIHIPKEQARAFQVRTGQTMRLIEIEGLQCADIAIFNTQNYRETYDPTVSYLLNSRQGTGNAKTLKYLYSRPPKLDVMFTITDDKVATNWCLSGGHCNHRTYELQGVEGYHRSCQDSLAEAIAPFGLTSLDAPDVFNAWMNVDYVDGRYQVGSAPTVKDDYIDFLAHMDCLVAISACPSELGLVNGGANKSLKVEIYNQ